MNEYNETIENGYNVRTYSNGTVTKSIIQSEIIETPITPLPYQPTNAEVAQMISDLQADLVIAGAI